MRKLKFRFWIGKEKKMCSWELMKKECDRLSILEMEGFIPLQFTGLLDKQGKEIYEGDIVLLKEFPNEVYWEELDCSFRLATCGDRQIDKTRLLSFAQIGYIISNIYENPELLKGNL